MIYTITMNPAIDCTITAGKIIPGRVNRADSETVRFGGKGINVSYVLKQFGAESILSGFTAGFTGDTLSAGLEAEGFACDFVKLESGMTRINMKLTSSNDDGDPDTELNAPGPTPTEAELDALTNKLAVLSEGDAVVLAGSMPPGVNADFVRTVADALPHGVALICDLSGDPLKAALSVRPTLVKPNVHELFELLEIPATPENLQDLSLIADGAARLISCGVANVLITMGSGGAYYAAASGDTGFVPAPDAAEAETASVRSAVGCGDSTVAGWLCGMGYAGDKVRDCAISAAGIDPELSNVEAAARLAVAFGSASYYFGFPASPETAKNMNA